MTTVVDLVDPPEPDAPETPPASPPRHARRRPVLVAAGWTLIVVVNALVLFAQIGVPFLHALMVASLNYYTLALLMLIAWRASARWHALPSPMARAGAHVLLGLAIVGVWWGVYVGFLRLKLGPDFWALVMADSWMFQLMTNAITYVGALAVVLAVQANDRARARERRDAARQIAAREAELTAIKAQMQPHFLMNALNTILALVDTNPGEARTTIVRLADLLHLVFDRLDAVQIPLAREMELIETYLDIERRRFGARLDVRIDIDPHALPLLVPPFLLQPLIENAIKHGIARQTRGGTVFVEGRVHGDRLRLIVRDSPSLAPVSPLPLVEGRGLTLTRRRLDSLYGSNYDLTFTREAREFIVAIDLPASIDDRWPRPHTGSGDLDAESHRDTSAPAAVRAAG